MTPRIWDGSATSALSTSTVRSHFLNRENLPYLVRRLLAIGRRHVIFRRPEELVPFVSRRQTGTANQNQFGLHRPRQVLGNGQANRAESARDQVDSALAQFGVRLRHRFKSQWLEVLHPPLSPAVRDKRVSRVLRDLQDDPADEILFLRAVGRRQHDVDATAADRGVFLFDDPAGARECGILRDEWLFARDFEHAARDDQDADFLQISFSQRLGQIQKGVEAAIHERLHPLSSRCVLAG